MAIHFDETNLLASMVGTDHGLSKQELASSKSLALASLGNFEKASTDQVYGFPHLPFQKDIVKEILTYASNMRGTFDTVCIVGIGGSALGAWALDCGLRGPHPVQATFSTKNPRLVILDNVDPSFIASAIQSMNPKKTLVVVIAKSGATAETCSTFLIVSHWLYARIGKAAARRIAVVTSEGRGDLKTLAVREGYATFHLPENVGGRFSVLSAVGLLPAALAGFDIEALLKGASQMNQLCWSKDLAKNLALRAALSHFLLLTKHNKPLQVAFPYSNRLWGMAFWFRQLWAESLGKARTRKGSW